MVKRLTIVLEDADGELLLQMAGSPRKQSDVISQLIRAAAVKRTAQSSPDLGSLRLQMIGLASELQSVARLIAQKEDLG